MKLLFFTCAKFYSVDMATNAISVFNVLEQISSPTFPVVMPSFATVTMLAREPDEPEKQTLQIRFTLDRKKLADLAVEANFQGGLRHRSIGEYAGLTIPKPGMLQVALRFNNKTHGTWMIEIKSSDKPSVTLAAQQAATPPKPKAKKAKKKSSRKLRAATAGTPKARKGGKKSSRKPRSS